MLGSSSLMKASGAKKLRWTPAQLSTALWLDAADSGTIIQSGGSVSQWNDKSGNNLNVSQATAANRPTVTAAALNGSNVLSFNGSHFLESTGNFPIIGDPAFSVFCVYLKSAATGGSITGWGNASLALRAAGFYDAGTIAAWAFAGNNSFPTTAVAAGAWVIANYSKSAGAISTTSKAYRNGVDVKTGTPSSNTPNIASDLLRVGQWSSIGTDRLIGSMAELIITSLDSSDNDRQLMEGYLAWKWGLAANLPVGHPYKSTPPTI